MIRERLTSNGPDSSHGIASSRRPVRSRRHERTLRRSGARLLLSILAMVACGGPLAAQTNRVLIDDIEIRPFGTGSDVSPFIEDWIRNRSVEVTLGFNFLPGESTDMDIVLHAVIRNSSGQIVAQSQPRPGTFSLNIRDIAASLSYTVRGDELNFLNSNPSRRDLTFTSGFSESSRLPAGTYHLEVTAWRVNRTTNAEEDQLSETVSHPFEILPISQDLEIEVEVTERSPFFSDWARNPDAVLVHITNRWSRSYQVYMEARVDEGATTVIRTNPGAGRRLPPIAILPQPEQTLHATDIPFFAPGIDPALRGDLFTIGDAYNDYRLGGRFPEGHEFRLCAELHDYTTDGIRGEYRCSNPFTIDYPPAPILHDPENEAPRTDEFPVFEWDHNLTPLLVPNVRYQLEVVQIPPTGRVTPDIFAMIDPARGFREDNIATRSFPITSRRTQLVPGDRYAWRVRALTPTLTPPVRFANDGYSEIWTFTYSSTTIAAPRLIGPGDGTTITLPETFDWTTVHSRDGSPARYLLKIKELPAGATADARFMERGFAVSTVSAPPYPASDSTPPYTLLTGHRYAWQVQAFDPVAGDPSIFENQGLSEIWTFTVGATDEPPSGDYSVMLQYPSNEDTLPDVRPPFVADLIIDRSAPKHLTLTIEELDHPGGTPQGTPTRFADAVTIPGSGPVLLLNRFGPGGDGSRTPLLTGDWSSQPGKTYRWTVEVRATAEGSVQYHNSATFVVAPRAHLLDPHDRRDMDPHLTPTPTMTYVVDRPTIGMAGFAPGEPHPFVMNPVIRLRGDDAIQYQTTQDLRFPGNRFNGSFGMPRLGDGIYSWVVDTKIGDRTVATSTAAEFTVGGAGTCLNSCACVEGIYPDNNSASVPYVGAPRFSIGFRPRVNASAVSNGRLYIWKRRGTEGHAETMSRAPDFIARFTGSDLRAHSGSAPELSVFDIDPRNDRGEQLHLDSASSYLWTIRVDYDPARVREDGASCTNTGDSSSVRFFTTLTPTRDIPECNPPVTNFTHPSSPDAIANELRIGGYTLTLDRANCTFGGDGRITGRGQVRTPDGTWSVEFTDLEVNNENQVIGGRATARTRDDVPAAIQGLMNQASINSDQVRRINELWQGGGTILEALTGDRKVPFGFTIDLGPVGSSSPTGWAFKAAYTKMVFEPTRAYFNLVVAVRMPVETSEGESTQWLGLMGQDIPMCVASGSRWRTAIRYLDDTRFGSPSMTDWEFVIKHSPEHEMPVDYVMQPGDGTALIWSERGFEQLHIEVGVRIPRNILVPQRENPTSHAVEDVPEGSDSSRVMLSGVFDIMRDGRTLPDDGDQPTDPLGGGFYMVADLPRSRIAGSDFKITARDITLDLSTSWSPHADAGATYSIAGVASGAIPTRGDDFNRPPSWTGLFIREATVDIPAINTPIGIRNAFSSSPLSFTAFAAPMAEAQLGDAMTIRLDTIDFRIDRGNFTQARIMSSMTFPGAIEGRIGLDLVYQQVPETADRSAVNAFVISLNAREDERIRITDFIAFTISRGSQMNVTFTDRPTGTDSSQWGFSFDISGGIKFTKRNESGEDNITIGGIDFEHFRFATDGRGLQAPTFTLFGTPIPIDTGRGGGFGGSGSGSGSESSSGSGSGGDGSGSGSGDAKQVGGFPIGLRSLGISFHGEGAQMGLEAVLTVSLTGEGDGPSFGGSVGLALDGALVMRDGGLQWQAPTLRLTSLSIDFRSDALTIAGQIDFYENDPVWGNGFSGSLEVSMAKMFQARADIKLGTRDDFRYWFIRGEFGITMETTPMSIGPVGIFGFIGGAYQHMQAEEIRNESGAVTDIRYTPTAENTFGIMAGVHIGINGKPSSFHAKIVLTARFSDERLTDIALDGKGWFMCDLERECNGPDDSWAQLHIGFDFVHDRFLATLAANISLRPLLLITAPPGSVEILFEPGNWHVYIGRGPFDVPEQRTIDATFFPDFAHIVAQSYMMAGNSIDVNIAGIPLHGGGFAAGVNVDIRAGGRFLIFYGEIWGHFRAELALIQVDETGSMCLRGANGWYALANLELGLGLAVGIDVDLWLVSGRYEIFRAEIGIALLVGGPDPTFVEGDAHGSFSILNGLVSGSFHYHMHVGDEVPRECLTAAIDGQFRMPEPIVSVSPAENATDVSVFTTIGLGFALRERGEIEVRREGERIRARFRLQQPLDVVAPDGTHVAGGLRIAGDGLSAEWSTDDVLLPQTRYTVTAVAIAEEFRGGRWVESKRQVKTWSFTTGDRPRDIYDGRIIAYTYPLDRQRYSYTEGHEGKHYVEVKRNMDYLFADMPPSQTLIAEYTDRNNTKQIVPARYEPYRSGCGGTIVIDDPPVTAGMTYHLRIIKRTDRDYGRLRFTDPWLGTTPINRSNYEQISASQAARIKALALSGTDVRQTSGESEYFLTERTQGSAQSRVLRRGQYTDSVMYDWFFAVGRYADPAEKFAAMSTSYNLRLGSFISFRMTSPEPIDDDISAAELLRNPSTGAPKSTKGGTSLKGGASTSTNKAVESWKNFLIENDRLARDYAYLVSQVGSADASRLRPYVLTTRSKLVNPNYLYVESTAPWTFADENHEYYQLRPDELRFEEQSSSTGLRLLGGAWSGSIGSGIGRIGGFTLAGVTSTSSGYSDEIVINPMNALNDFNGMVWRYRNARYVTIPTGPLGLIRVPLATQLSPATLTKTDEIGTRSWMTTPSGAYTIGLTAQTFNWKLQSFFESQASASYARQQNVRRLEWISTAGTPSAIDFGEISCGSPGRIPFITIPLHVP